MNKAMEQIEARIEILKSRKEEFEEKKSELEKKLNFLIQNKMPIYDTKNKIRECDYKIEMFSDLLKTNQAFYLYYSISPTELVN
jgi:hypothetical protein